MFTFNIKDAKLKSKEIIKTTKPSPMLVALCFAVYSYIFSLLSFLLTKSDHSIINAVLALCLFTISNIIIGIGSDYYSLKVLRGESTSYDDSFIALRKGTPSNMVNLSLLTSLARWVCGILVGIGSLIPYYLFRMSTYIMYDEDCTAKDAMKKSMKIMKGHYIQAIKLDLSFILWHILTFITLGLADLYLMPYKKITVAQFYEELIKEYNANN